MDEIFGDIEQDGDKKREEKCPAKGRSWQNGFGPEV